MQMLLQKKYQVCPEFREALHKSNSIICEATSHPFWASGIPGIRRTLETDPAQWTGHNMLGCLLIDLREAVAAPLIDLRDAVKTSESTPAKAIHDTEQMAHTLSIADSPEAANDPPDRTLTDTETPAATNAPLNRAITDLGSTDEPSENDTQEHTQETNENDKSEGEDDDEPEDCILVIADSVLAGTGTEENVILAAQSGAKLKDTETMLLSGKEQTENKHVSDIVLALGTNDITSTGNTNATILQLQKAVHTTMETFPDANIYMSSVTPRRGPSRSTAHLVNNVNRKIEAVNDFMGELAKSDPKLHYIKNHKVFEVPKGQENKIHSVTDSLGVHLTPEGRKRLMRNIIDRVKQIIQTKTPSVSRSKRIRSEDTPPSAEKDQKTLKLLEDHTSK